MRLNEGSIQISSQMVAKSLLEVPVLVLGLIFIEITRGPFHVRDDTIVTLRFLCLNVRKVSLVAICSVI